MKRIILFIAILCSLSVSAQRTYKIEGLPQRFTTVLGVPIKSSSFYNTSSDSAVIFFDPADTSTLFFKYKGLSKKLAGSRVPWDSITGIPSNFSTTYALSNDVQDSIQARIRTSVAAATYTPITRFLDSLTNIQSRIQSKLTKSDADTYYPAIQRMLDSLTAVQSRVQTKEPFISPGTSAQYWRGDKTWQTLDKSAVGLSAVPNVDATNPANISQSATYRFVTDSEKSTWNAKQNALGYTPENIANKGIANGYADLDAGGKIPASRIDFGQTGQTFVVASQSAMLAVSGANIGALAIRTDENKNYRLIAQPASTLANWQVLLSPDAPVQSVNGFTGNVNLLTTHISEGSNYWWTAARSRAAQSLTVSGSSGSATYDNTTGVLNIPTYTLAGLGGQPALSGTGFVKISGTTITYDNSTYLTSYTETDPTIYAWAKATTKPSYSWGEITGTVPTWNQNTTGTAASLSAVLSSTLGGAGSVSGILKANGSGTVSAAVAGTDYVAPSALSSYVPYSGATTNVNLGLNSITSRAINLEDGFGANVGNFQVGAVTSNRFYIFNGTLGIDNITISPSTGITTFAREINGTSAAFSGAGSFLGNVGIGTASPLEKFEIAGNVGNIRLYGRTGVIDNNLSSNLYYNGTSWVRDVLGGASVIYMAGGILTFNTTSATSGFPDERGRITSAGRWLINTTTDNGTDALQVAGSGLFSSGGTANLRIKGNSTTGFDIQNDVGGSYLVNRDNAPLYFFTNNTQRLEIAAGGAAAFSSSVTATKMQYTGSGELFYSNNAGTSSVFGRFVNSGGDFYIGSDNSSGTQFPFSSAYATVFYSEGARDMIFWTNGTKALTINSTQAANFSSSVTATGFIKSGSSDSYFLLGGGGHVATSTYATTASLSSYVNTTGNQYEIGGNKSFLGAVEVVSLKTTGGPGTPGVLKFGGKTNDTVFTAGSQYVLPVNIDGTTYYIRLWAGIN